MTRYPEIRILLFAREPVYGKVKTRLHEAIGPRKAFQLYCAMLRYQVRRLQDANLAPWELWVSGNPDNPQIRSMDLKVPVRRQQGDDLGERMRAAVAEALKESAAVLLLGTDCPSVDVDYLEDALRQLRGGRQAVIGPADDGGYVLLGLRECREELFIDIPWGTARVLSTTLERLENGGVDYGLLATRWDVDRADDLVRLAELQPPLNFQLEDES